MIGVWTEEEFWENLIFAFTLAIITFFTTLTTAYVRSYIMKKV